MGTGNGTSTRNGPWRMVAAWYIAASAGGGSRRVPSTISASSNRCISKSSSSTPARSTTISSAAAVSHASTSGRKPVRVRGSTRVVCHTSPKIQVWVDPTTVA